MAKGKAVQKQEEQAVANPEVDDYFLQDMDAGHEEMSSEDIATPFLSILQPLSPQVQKESDDFIEGAEAGMFFNSVSNNFYSGDTGLLVVPAHFQSRWIEWVTRAHGGGFVRQYEAGEEPPGIRKGDINVYLTEEGTPWEGDLMDKKGNLLPSHQAVKTHMHYLIVVPPFGEPEPVIFSVSSTGLTPSGKWNGAINAQTIPGKGRLPRFASIWLLENHFRQNDAGTWYSFKASHQKRLSPSTNENDLALYTMAKAMKEAVQADRLKVDHNQATKSQAKETPAGDAFEGDAPEGKEYF